MAVFYSKMFFLHPSNDRRSNRIISEGVDYQVGTAVNTTLLLENAIAEEKRNETLALQERAFMERFMRKLIDGCYGEGSFTDVTQATNGNNGITLKEIFDKLDVLGVGVLEKSQFISAVRNSNPSILDEEAEKAYKLLDLDESGSITGEEFDVLLSGLTFSGQALHKQMRCCQLQTHANEKRKKHEHSKLDEQRKATYRLARLLENEAARTSYDQRKIVRLRAQVVLCQRMPELVRAWRVRRQRLNYKLLDFDHALVDL
eukprot:gnl/MRDRNA2_/MRDRNA2_216750_c0_seq1.p1 gnl/MRDRNA2_/MRDRNA2_216750_c0~~gnl/MRDRNA2_/MRDRNA2_216750_c0_seq1.p1  ORF type:complete len:282 (+),score=56.53 gnl/MRDRNA2_/MRDRNA2_216750_c0_seq1:71-847(+)